MEAGFPIASPGDYESVRAIAETVGQRDDSPVICGLARTGREDILRAADAVKSARRKRIHIFLSTSPLHMKYKLRMEPDEVLQLAIDSVTLARQFADDVEWSAEDGTRTEPDFLCRCVGGRDQGWRDHHQHPRHGPATPCPRTSPVFSP